MNTNFKDAMFIGYDINEMKFNQSKLLCLLSSLNEGSELDLTKKNVALIFNHEKKKIFNHEKNSITKNFCASYLV